MSGRAAVLGLLLSCRCAEETASSEPVLTHSSTVAPAGDTEGPDPVDMQGRQVRVAAAGELTLDGEAIADITQLQSRLQADRHPDEGARSLTADASLQWGQLLPVIRVLAEPPAPSFTRIIQPGMSEVLELEWWTRHPGQVSVSDRGERKTPLTLWVDMAPQGLLFNGYELEESQIIDHVRATSKVSSGGAVPVLLRVHESIHWGRVLELAAHLDSALETGRVALWHEPLSQSD